MKANTNLLILLSIIALLTGCAGFNDSLFAPTPSYGNSYGNNYYDPYGSSYYNNRYEADRARDEREELRRERQRAENERERLEQERQRSAVPVRQPSYESCPSGFSPSESKCSSDERRRGCRDIRLPSGMGCVSR